MARVEALAAEQVLGQEGLRIEVLEAQVLELGGEFVAHARLGALRELAEFAQCPQGVGQHLGELVGPDQNDGEHDQCHDFERADVGKHPCLPWGW
ncbi:hypothetical protein ACFQ51_40650 [Streptomyces kaempferi]